MTAGKFNKVEIGIQRSKDGWHVIVDVNGKPWMRSSPLPDRETAIRYCDMVAKESDKIDHEGSGHA